MKNLISEKTNNANSQINWDNLDMLWAKQYEKDYVITPSIRNW
jgi:hypothetical protein